MLWEKTEKLISSSMIRRRIMEEKSWNEFVPDATYRFVVEQGIDQRIRHTAENH